MAQEFHDRRDGVDRATLLDWITAHRTNSTLLLRCSHIVFPVIAGVIGATISGLASPAAAGGVATAARQENRPPILWADPGALENATREICLNEPGRCGEPIERPQPSGEFVFSARRYKADDAEPWRFFVGGLTLLVFMRIMDARAESVRRRREKYIRFYEWPPGLLDRFAKHYPSLTDEDKELVSQGLRQFFVAYLNSEKQYCPMPSRIVDHLWHEFILYTNAYKEFCNKAFGAFLHHTPAVALSPDDKRDNDGLRRVWRQSCLQEGVDPRKAALLPLLFALDMQLNIPDGFHYELDCTALREAGEASAHCVADLASGCGGGGCGSGCGGGCGGCGGCGGG